ncbi:protein RESISTANCE TO PHYTOPHTHORA 1, chloroplastic [Phragmites australis]|uniref:protein RESISTANCE TO PHYTOPHTHORA 1, chloroplastic n=1 Tax=Phragmites australis TaxID=29695 RepID=UPI002D7764F1|nr:protein RESISTANCE TO PHYTOPHTHORA 1, chloroplastic [Phragmites australis]
MRTLSGGCAFAIANCASLPVASALRSPSATLSWRSAGCRRRSRRQLSSARASTDDSGSGDSAGAVAAEAYTVGDSLQREEGGSGEGGASAESSAGKQPPPVNPKIDKELKKAVQKTAATFAPRASTKTKNPAVPGSALYTVFEVQGYASMLMGGALSFNLVFPSNEPDIWRLMGMWSIWMFTIPSLRARDCSNKEKEALNYLFLLIPLVNVIIPFFVKSFAVVWSADTLAFFVMYAWKLGWLQRSE